MELLEQLKQRAHNNLRRIVLPEGDEPRTLEAADRLLADQSAKLILIGDADKIHAMAADKGLKHIGEATIVNPETDPKMPVYADLLYELRKNKGMTHEEAEQKAKDPLYLGCLMIKNGDADGEVAGARGTTADTIRPAFQIIKTQPCVSVVSGAFLMITPATQLGENGLLVFADCAVNPCPTAEQMVDIALATARTFRSLVGKQPQVAFLSCSARGSAKHELVDKVAEAARLTKAKFEELGLDAVVDGEIQADAAIVPAVALQKNPGGAIKGDANVLIFPDLQAGNICYKLVQRLGGATALGPVVQGVAKPINDLSRGCSAEDIFGNICITVGQTL